MDKDKNIVDQIEKLKEQLKQLELQLSNSGVGKTNDDNKSEVKSGEKRPKNAQNTNKTPKNSHKVAKNGEKWQKKPAKILEGTIDQNLQFQTSNKQTYEIDEKNIVDNQLVMGDEVILEFKDNKIDKLKVARRAKREVIEGLVTEKNSLLYAVSKHSVHKLLDYDVTTKGVLKGFEVNLLVPKDLGDKAKVCVVKDIESSGNHTIKPKEGAVEIKKAPNYDPRVLDEDDLV